jgi:LysM repeat protein
MDGRRGSPARLLAPISLIAFVLALFFVIASSDTSDDSDGSGDRGAEQTQQISTIGGTETEPRVSGNFYTVKTGDTLAAIADAVGLTLTRLQELNPDIDAQQLVSGQKIRIRE